MEDNMFKEASEVLAGEEKAWKEWDRKLGRRCDWGSSVDVALYRSDLRRSERDKLIKELTPNRTCPCCGKYVASSRSWVINRRKTLAICRSCFFRTMPDSDVEREIRIRRVIFSKMQVRFDINGFNLQAAREGCEITQAEFARQCGWARSYQGKLEKGSVVAVKLETAEVILGVFAKFGYLTMDCL